MIRQVYSGDELLKQFKSLQSKDRFCVKKMLEEAGRVANGQGECNTYSDIFDPEKKLIVMMMSGIRKNFYDQFNDIGV